MKNIILLILVAMPLCLYSQNSELFGRLSAAESSGLNNRYSKEVTGAEFFSVNKNVLNQILKSPSKTLDVKIPLDNVNAGLKLFEYNILTDDAVISEMTAEGQKIYKADIPFKCFKGYYNNDVNTMAVICLGESFIKGILFTESGSYTLSSFGEDKLSDNCILYEDNKFLGKNNFRCGSEGFETPQRVQQKMQNLNNINLTNTFLQANIAIEIDKITYTGWGSSVPNSTSNALALFSVVSALYNRDINVKLSVPFINVWTTTDPYTGNTSDVLLSQFRNYWNSHFTNVNRTLAHFLTRKNGTLGGIAFLDVLCDSYTSGMGYGFSNILGGYGQLPNYSWDVMVVAHELGHNFGSPHTFSCSWPGGPIDTCYEVEGNCYSGPTFARSGTIMSYCHLNGNIDLRLGFGPLPKALIRTGAEGAGCMSPAAEQLLLSYPRGGEIFPTNSQQYIYFGTSSTANLNIDLTTNNGATWSSLGTNVPAQQHYYVWSVPYIPTSTNCKIKIYDPLNLSFADTVDGVFQIKATMTNISLILPASGASYFTTQNDTSKIVFSWTSSGTLPGITYKWKIRKGGGQYVAFASDSNGTAKRISVRKSRLDSLAAYTFGLTGDSVLCGWSATTYLNSDSLSSEVRILTVRTNTVGVNNISSVIPVMHKLHSNYPNPFNPVTKIKFEIPKDEFVKIAVYDLSGKAVSYLVNERLRAGIYETDFDGNNLASGTYFYKIETNSFVETRKMVLIK